MRYKEYHPPHIYLEAGTYFITASTLDKKNVFNSEQKKELLKVTSKNAAKRYEIELYAWVILSNHYHLLLKTQDKQGIYKFIKSLHGKSALELNKLDGTLGRQVWYNYWDRCPRGEKDFYTFFNYIHINPIKHGYVRVKEGLFIKSGEEIVINEQALDNLHHALRQYKFSSYNYYLNKYGE